MNERLVLSLCPVLVSLASAAFAQDRIAACPNGGHIHGEPPPKGFEQWCEVMIADGHATRSGPWMAWYPSGSVRARGEYVGGKRDGEWFVYGASGELLSSRIYIVGELVSDQRGDAKDSFGEASQSRTAPSAPAKEPADRPSRPTAVSEPAGRAPALRTAAANEPDHDRFLYSAVGPGRGNFVVGIGGRAWVIVPMVDAQLVYGLGDSLDLELRGATVGVVSDVGSGVRWRLIGNETISMAVRADAAVIGFAFNAGRGQSGLLAGPAPGLLLSMGGRSAQVTLGLDAPLFFGAVEITGDVGPGGTVLPLFRPNIAVEVAVDRSINLFAQAQMYVSTHGNIVLPTVAVGVSW
jgi:hypothetical protein